MTINISTPDVVAARFAGALYGLVLNSSTMNVVLGIGTSTTAMNSLLDNLYATDFGSQTTLAVATSVAVNVGLSGNQPAINAIKATLDGAGAGHQGSALSALLGSFAQMTSDPVYGAAATAWENQVYNADAYAHVATNTGFQVIGSMSTTIPVPTLSYTLTTGVDTWGNAAATNPQTFNASTTDSLSVFDKLTGGTSTSDSLSANITAVALPAGMTVTGIEAATINGTGVTLSADVSGWTGLLSLTTVNAGATGAVSTITAATTTDVNSTVNSTTGGALTIAGGKNVTTTQTGSTGGALIIAGEVGTVTVNDKAVATTVLIDGGTNVNATITGQTNVTSTIGIGTTTKPSGTNTLVASTNAAANLTQGNITVKGGTAISITDNLLAATVDGTTTVTGGTIAVTGATTTTSVTVNQTATAAARLPATGVTGVPAVGAVVAAPGTQGVTAVTAVVAVTAATARTGVVNGAVTIADANASATSNTIASATLAYAGAGSTITSNALTSLSLTGGLDLTLNRTLANSSATLALTANALAGANTITDTNNEITTLNVTTASADSALTAFTDTGLTTLTVAGTNVFKLAAINGSLTSIAVSGAAGFNDGGAAAGSGFAARVGAATLTTTSSGAITAVLDATTQTFVGSTGKDTITINSTANATKVVTGGSGTTDELILAGGAYALTAATAAKVTGFEILGVRSNVTGMIDASVLGTFNTIHVVADAAGTIAFTKVATGAALNIDAATTSTTYGVIDANGVNDSVTVTLGAAASNTVNFGTVVLQDANAVGIGTVNLVSNGVNITAGASAANTHTMVLTDNGMKALNFSGTSGLTMTTMDQASTQATAITINNTNTSNFGLLASTLVDANLGSLTFTGTGKSAITLLTDATSTTLGISNTGSQTAVITGIASTATMTSMTLSGNVQVGTGLVGSATGVLLTNTGGITISGATDHAPVRAILTGAVTGNTDTITLGNGNNSITDTSSATTATVNITVGTGSNNIVVGNGAQALDSVYSITLGSHTATTGIDSVQVNTAGANFATVVNNTITGAVTGDKVLFGSDAGMTSTGTLTATASVASAASLAAAITALEAAASVAHKVVYGVYGGDTYVAESITGTPAAADVTLIKIVGTHTMSATNDGGVAIDYITLLS